MKRTTLTSKKTQTKENQTIEVFFKKINNSASPNETHALNSHTSPTNKKRKHSPTHRNNLNNKSESSTEAVNSSSILKYLKDESPPKNQVVVLQITPNKTPSPLQKKVRTSGRTPVKKLFEKTPKKVAGSADIIDAFVKITPTKSAEKKNNVASFADQSPTYSGKLAAVVQHNERTPTKLDISSDHNESTKHSAVRNIFANNETPDSHFEDSWDNSFNFITPCYTLDLSTSQHCSVLEVNAFSNQTVLLLESTKTGEKCLCTLSGFWRELPIKKQNILHVTAKLENSSWIVSNDAGLIVFEPDFLVSSTSVVASLFCKRRSVITERYRSYDPENKFMVLGSLVHKLLQLCLKADDSRISSIEIVLKNLLKSKETVRMLYAASLQSEEIELQMKEYIPRIHSFVEEYIKGNPSEPKKENWKGKIDAIQDIEENFWTPELGIKGKVDVTIRSGNSVMPVEVKTGKTSLSLEHRGQVMLYIIMMAKFGYKVHSGLLFYLKDGTLKEIKPSDSEVRDIMILRNELAYYLTKTPINSISEMDDVEALFANSTKSDYLPKPINHHSACKSCPYNTVCCAFLKTENYDLSSHSNLKDVQNDVLSHLEKNHLDYFIRWSTLLTLEASHRRDLKSFREVFTVEANDREKYGKCISNVQISGVEECNDQYHMSFKKTNENANLMASGIAENNYVVISTDTRPAAATGFVTNIDNKTISVLADRNLNKKYPNHNFHIDTYDSDNVNLFNMANLALLLEKSERSHKLRRFIIDKEKPSFQTKLPRVVATKGAAILQRLNRVQQRAVLKAVSAEDYLLITGMPGTGKTSTIVALVQLLVELDQTVLITSHTHSAVDNVCLRLIKYGVQNILRLGALTKIHPDLISKSETQLTKDCLTPTDLDNCYNKAKIVAVTCLGSGHALLSKRTFDVCIIDESTQVLQPSVIRLLMASKKFVLVGDPKQLPPVVRNDEARSKGMSESLFERLECAEANVALNLNYRMNMEITKLANEFMYKGELLTANDEVANAHLALPKPEVLEPYVVAHPWLKEVLDESLSNSVKVVDTGPTWNIDVEADLNLGGDKVFENGEIQRCSNAAESAIVVLIVQVLLKAGIPEQFIGVIAPYRAQTLQLSKLLKKTGVDVNTADQFQGKDKEIIILSCIKSFQQNLQINRSNEILEDARRLNVIITRAKQKLVIVGDVDSLKTYQTLQRLFHCLEESCFVMCDVGFVNIRNIIKYLEF